MQLDDFDFELPSQLIAQYPLDERSASRLLQLSGRGLHHGQFTDILDLLRAGDVLVVNDTQVVKARLFAVKDTGGRAEILFERLLEPDQALCQVRVSKPVADGGYLWIEDHGIRSLGREGSFYRLHFPLPVLEFLERYGHVPLPPYIDRQDDASVDDQRYQTVYHQHPGAVAAPTAGLHFSEALLAELQSRGVELTAVTLHVGAGTFQPVRNDIDSHEMHREYYQVSERSAEIITRARREQRRIVAVGTTVVRTLESVAAAHQQQVVACRGDTRLFIKPGFQFACVDVLITNFHLPRSTLMLLVCAFGGYEPVMQAYQQAVAEGYRFFSYGDAMWIDRRD